MERSEAAEGGTRSLFDGAMRLLRQQAILSAVAGLFEERDIDVFVVSFPKCGRTWLRVQLGRVFQQYFHLDVENLVEVQEIAERHPAIPRLRFTHPGRPQEKRADELSAAWVDYFRFRKVIFLMRDPRDVVVSLYHERTKRGMEPVFSGSLSEFIHEPVGSFDTLIAFYNIWAARRGAEKRTLVVRYEDMHASPESTLRAVLEFIRLGRIGTREIFDAIAFTQFERMKEMERNNVLKSWRLSPGNPDDPNSFKTRRGRVGGYQDELSEEEIASLNRRMATSLRVPY